MAAQNTNPPAVTLRSDFKFNEVKFQPPTARLIRPGSPQLPIPGPAPPTAPTEPVAPLGVLSNFKGTWVGNGFNAIFRPNSVAPTTTTFPNPIDPPPPTKPNENVLELNLTTETLTFSAPLGNVPNRGLEEQNDITLNGVPYVQAINDVTNILTGKADGAPTGIHFEPGLWMHVPATTATPVLGETLVRMASIPHGTTINAQGLAPTATFPGPPQFELVDITPFPVGNPSKRIPFKAQKVDDTATARLPQDLTPFIAAGTITQRYLDNLNLILKDANDGKTITETTVFKVSTDSAGLGLGLGGGTDNIAFLQGDVSTNEANAHAALMESTFWISKVQHTLHIPVFHPGQAPLKIKPPVPTPGPGPRPQIPLPVPVFHVVPPVPIKAPRTIKVTSLQIQYTQTVNLNFAGLTWPHVSVATLVPSGELSVPSGAW